MAQLNKEFAETVERIEASTIDRACELLKEYHDGIGSFLLDAVASLCGISTDKIISSKKQIDEVRARWFYWYAYRYMTKESYEAIGLIHQGIKTFTVSSVGQGLFKMSALIDRDNIWAKRWAIIKRIIDSILTPRNETTCETITLRIIAPKGVKVELKQE